MRIIAVANQKGGVGKTTTAINLAASLAHMGQETLLVDLDPQTNLSSGLGVHVSDGDRHMYHVVLDGAPLEEAVRRTAVEWLDVAPSHPDLYGAEVELVAAENREGRLKKAFEGFRREYKFVLVDCPPALNLLTINALAAAHSVLIPLPCEYYALEGLSMLVRTMDRVRGSLNPSLELEGVLITMFDPRTNLTQQVMSELRKHFGDKVYRTVIPRNVRLAEAPSFGKPVLLHDKASTGAAAYLALAKELVERRGALPGPADAFGAVAPESGAVPAPPEETAAPVTTY
jgi:chromosome partitioning protein